VIRILLVDDHPVVREGLAAILASEHDLEVAAQAATGEQALREAERIDFDVAVIDVRLPGMNGVETCAELIAAHPTVKVIILTSFPHEGTLYDALTAGAKAFLVKTTDRLALRQAVRSVMRGETFFDPQVSGKLVHLATRGRRAKGPHDLTLMEMRVLEYLPRGMTNAEIARELGVSTQTVKTHLAHAMRKLKARDRTQALAVAMREGLA
jgi:DNA-binding NarL/FixJ family response regulator